MALYAVITDSNTLVISDLLSTRSEDVSRVEIRELLTSYDIEKDIILSILFEYYTFMRMLKQCTVSGSPRNVIFVGLSKCDKCVKTQLLGVPIRVLNSQCIQYVLRRCSCFTEHNCYICNERGLATRDVSPPYYHYQCTLKELPTLITCVKCCSQYISDIKECPKCNEYKYEKCIICKHYKYYKSGSYKICTCDVIYNNAINTTNCVLCDEELDEHNYTEYNPHSTMYRSAITCDVCADKYNHCVICGIRFDYITKTRKSSRSATITEYGITLKYGVTLKYDDNHKTNTKWTWDYINNEVADYIRKNSYINARTCKCIYTDKINPKCRSCTTHDAVDRVFGWYDDGSSHRIPSDVGICNNCIHFE